MNDFSALESIFTAALQKGSPEERAAFLEEACGPNVEVRRGVERLLQAHGRAGSFLKAPAPPVTTNDPTDERLGSAIGPYKLLEKIGEGGMGEVWVADQQEPIRRRVALKVIKPGMDSRAVLARFEAERQALALMDHPNIARVLDAGTTEGEPGGVSPGRPYFVMELVKGTPITQFCDVRKHSPRERLELFVPVCQAIQHAHQKGVIHRDIKPSNVLVELYDDRPVPKVIDFGVAKAIGQRLTEKTLYTGFGTLIGTPAYMAPEQATFNALDVDTRADVYSLGVLLYELLAGSPPFEPEQLKQVALEEVLRLVREVEPQRPSTRLSTSQSKATIAAVRQSDPDKLARLMRGELDWIVMRALEKDRARRYDTAAGLARDVERYLKGDAVEACPPTVGYRLRKFARQHKVGFAAASAVAAALLLGVALSLWQAVRATHAEHATAAERDKTAEQRDLAVKASKEAADQRDATSAALGQLERNQEEMRTNRYAWDLQTLPLAWEAGNVEQARQLLARQDPDLRGFEWNYWNRKTQAELSSQQLPGVQRSTVGSEWVFSDDGARVAHCTGSFALPDSKEDLTPVVTVWDVASRKRLLTRKVPMELPDQGPGLSTAISSHIRLSADGKRIAVLCCTGKSTGPLANSPTGVHRLQVVDIAGDKVILDHDGGKDQRVLGGSVSDPIWFSPDGKKLAVVGRLNREANDRFVRDAIHIWDLESQKEPVTIECLGALDRPFTADGSRIVVPVRDDTARTLKVFETATGKELQRWDMAGSNVEISPDGTRLASVAWQKPAEGSGSEATQVLQIWDAAGKKLHSFTLPYSPPPSREPGPTGRPVVARLGLHFTQDGSRLLVLRRNPVGEADMVVVDPLDGRLLFTVSFPESMTVRSVLRSGFPLICPGVKQLVFPLDNHIQTWDMTTGKPMLTLRGHTHSVRATWVSPDGRLRSVDAGGTLMEWEMRAAEPEFLATGFAAITMEGPTTSSDGRWVVATAHGMDRRLVSSILVWDTANANRRTTLTPTPERRRRGWLGISNTGRLVVAQAQDSFRPSSRERFPLVELKVYDVTTGKELAREAFAGLGEFSFNGVQISPDGRTIAVGMRTNEKAGAMQLKLIDAATGRERRTLPLADSRLGGLRFSPDGRRLAAVVLPDSAPEAAAETQSATLMILDVATGNRLASADVKPVTFHPFEWNSDGTRLAMGQSGGSMITIHDTATGKRLQTIALPHHENARQRLLNVAFSPDGRRLVTVLQLGAPGAPAQVKVWDAASAKELLTLTPLRRTRLGSPGPDRSSVTFTPDGHRLRYLDLESSFNAIGLTVTTWDATPVPNTTPP